MSERTSSRGTFKTLDLFCGCGGLATGFALASDEGLGRLQCVGAIDNWKEACDAFTSNHSVGATCTNISRESVLEVLERSGGVDVVAGGPPCQGFSTSGNRALEDPRNALVREFFGAVELAQPKAFLMENVAGFTNFQGGAIMREVLDLSRGFGYKVFPGLVLASLCGVPQRRRRFILVGLRTGEFRFPNQDHPTAGITDELLFENEQLSPADDLVVDQRPSDGDEEWTFDDATGDLEEIEAGECSTRYRTEPQNAYQEWARNGAPTLVADHVAGSHKPYFIEMMSHIPPGRSAMEPEIREQMPERLRPKSGFPNSYARILGSEPAPTITRNFTTPSSANCIHPRKNRSLTLREGARCQSFPDRYVFAASHGARRLMIGNAVPPLLGKALGVQLLHALCGSTTKSLSALANTKS